MKILMTGGLIPASLGKRMRLLGISKEYINSALKIPS
jgi:hypothetical protein